MAATVTVVVCDVEGSTALLERVGEARYAALVVEYEALLDAASVEHGGTRDGHLLAFGSVRAALRCAVALQRAELPFRVRAGVHTGELERHDGELRGRALVKAARICGLARGGEILASAVVRDLADLDAAEGDLWFDDEAEVELRGLRGRHVVVPVRWHERERPPVRVVIADDAAIVRDGVAALLREHGFDVVATASDAAGLHDAVERPQADPRRAGDLRAYPRPDSQGLANLVWDDFEVRKATVATP